MRPNKEKDGQNTFVGIPMNSEFILRIAMTPLKI
jgi:hypothetical protein